MKIRSNKVWVDEKLQPKVVEIKDNKIVNVLDYDSEFDQDYGDNLILPGFIDIHTHGYAGVNANRPTIEGLDMWANNLPTEGVTSFLITTATQSYDDNIKALNIINDYIEGQSSGANALGINVEGNFINEKHRGAQDINTIVKPDPKILDDYLKASNNHIKSVICAVELDDDLAFTKNAVEKGVAVSVGHTGASYEDVTKAIEVGLTGVTHTGNGMIGFHHRRPGVFGAAMNRDELYAEAIVDGHHLDFEVVNILGTLKGKDKLVLVTDSSSYKDFDGEEEGYKRTIGEDGTIRNAEGNLSGSALKYNKGVYNAIHKARLSWETAINAATINPAKYLKVDDKKGLLKAGYDADIVVVDDNFDVIKTYVGGVEY